MVYLTVLFSAASHFLLSWPQPLRFARGSCVYVLPSGEHRLGMFWPPMLSYVERSQIPRQNRCRFPNWVAILTFSFSAMCQHFSLVAMHRSCFSKICYKLCPCFMYTISLLCRHFMEFRVFSSCHRLKSVFSSCRHLEALRFARRHWSCAVLKEFTRAKNARFWRGLICYGKRVERRVLWSWSIISID